jgi:hypothetical protein
VSPGAAFPNLHGFSGFVTLDTPLTVAGAARASTRFPFQFPHFNFQGETQREARMLTSCKRVNGGEAAVSSALALTLRCLPTNIAAVCGACDYAQAQ